MLILGIGNFFYGEKIPAGGGLGYDGIVYGEMVKKLPEMISGQNISGYYAHRFLPSMLVRGGMIMSGVTITDVNIVKSYQIYNIILIILANIVWALVCNTKNISLNGRWIGFSALFLNYMCAKNTLYYPVLTDMSALFVGLLMLLFYIRQKPTLLLISSFFGSFIWQLTPVIGGLLLFFPAAKITDETQAIKTSICQNFLKDNIKKISFWSIAISVVAYFAVWFAGLWKIWNAQEAWRLIELQMLITSTPSIICFGILSILLFGSISYWKKSALLFNARCIRVIFAIFFPYLFITYLSKNYQIKSTSIPVISQLLLIIQPPSGKFLLPYLSISIFWGPLVIVALAICFKYIQSTRDLGLGFTIVSIVNLALALTCEPRFITLGWPFFVLATVMALEKVSMTRAFFLSYALITIVMSKIWLKINIYPWVGNDYVGISKLPKQLFFMNFGMWMNWWTYAIQFCFVILCIVLFRNILSDTRCSNNSLQP